MNQDPGTRPDPAPGELLWGKRAVDEGLIRADQLEECLREQRDARARGAELPLETLLLQKNLVKVEDLQRLLQDHYFRAKSLPDLPRYEIRESLGEGATAHVYRAWDRELNRPVALKILRSTMGLNHFARERFRREAQATASLSHPNVITLYDAGEHEGAFYLVMELVEGTSLTKTLSQKPELSKLVEILEKAARGVGAAHRRNIVHRDLKPENILVNAAGEPKVGDFGLAHVADSATQLTRVGVALGTPCYMSPEQVEGRREDLSARTDVYALGVILYEILTGHPPHLAPTIPELYGLILKEEPAPPHWEKPGVPTDLEVVALKALDKEPAGRYADADAFADDLRRYLSGEPVLARPLTRSDRIRRAIRRRRTLILSVAAAALAICGLGAWALHFSASKGHAVEALREERRKAEEDEREAMKLLETARPALDQAARYLYAKDASYAELVRRVDERIGTIQEALRKAPRRALGHYLLGRAWEIKGWNAQAETEYRKAAELEPDFGPAAYQLGRLYMARASLVALSLSKEDRVRRRSEDERLTQEAKGWFEKAARLGTGLEDELQRDISVVMAAFVREDKDAVRRLANSAIDRFRGREGEEEFHLLLGIASEGDAQLAAVERALALRPKYPLALMIRAVARLRSGNLEGAIADCSAALEISPRMIEAYYHRGLMRKQKRDFEGALGDLDTALRLDPSFGHASVVRGTVHALRGEIEKAMADFARALEIDPADDYAYYNRGIARTEQKEFRAAVEDFTQTIRLNPKYASAYISRGRALAGTGDLDGAIRDFNEALWINPKSAQALHNRGTARHARQEFDLALADFTEAIRLDPNYPDAYFNRALSRVLRKQPAPALEDLQKALELRPDWLEAHSLRAHARSLTGDKAGAVADARKALQLGAKGLEKDLMERILKEAGENP